GTNGDIPVPGDYDADGRTDIAVWRPSNGVWYIARSTLGLSIFQWGINGDKPFSGDFDGDGKADAVIWRPSNGVWYVIQSSSSIPVIALWGLNG
ncbi:VCBS repeat-containing protein, partial [Escherichia coli]|nr:VCBS repeat-containing protein [Escherichia coli]